MPTKIEVLNQAKVENAIIYLPDVKLEREEYLEIAKSLNFIGAKWKGGKTRGFVFDKTITHENAVELLAKAQESNIKEPKKEFQFFETPDELADKMVKLAESQPSDLVLEPSAGRGAIVNAIKRKLPGKIVDCFEISDINRMVLEKIPGLVVRGWDFLQAKPEQLPEYDKIIANPPFSKNQDITHIYKMWDCLGDGGTLVAIISTHWEKSKNKKETAFRQWLTEQKAKIIPLERGVFSESGTKIASNILIIKKPQQEY